MGWSSAREGSETPSVIEGNVACLKREQMSG